MVFLVSLDWNPKRNSRSFSAAADTNVGLSPAAGLEVFGGEFRKF